MRFRLRTRVAISFALLSLVVAGVVSITTYTYAKNYLLNQRQNAALTRAVLDSRAVGIALSNGATPSEALAQVPSVGTSIPILQVDGAWFTTDSLFPGEALPPDLIGVAHPNGAQQRFTYDGAPYFAVAIPILDETYVEAFPLRDLDRTLRVGGWALVALSLLAAMFGAIIGVTAVGRILGPIRRLARGAQRVAGGELSTRIEMTGDPDVDPLAQSFNEMAEAVQARIARERRFTANVSHELRSPLTSVLGTAELLESHADRLPEREAGLVTVLVEQVRRMSQMLLDLLEISRITADEPPQWESADIAGLCKDVAVDRGVDPMLVIGDRPVVRTDARRLERIVGNLLDNAQRHGGGVVNVVIERDSQEFRILVDDAGPGIAEADRERLFEPFARGESGGPAEGAGLGLAIAREQALALGGNVTVGISPDGGARFAALLPIDEGNFG